MKVLITSSLFGRRVERLQARNSSATWLPLNYRREEAFLKSMPGSPGALHVPFISGAILAVTMFVDAAYIVLSFRLTSDFAGLYTYW